MVKALFALAKYLTWWFIRPLGSRLFCKSHTHAAKIKFQQNACSSCIKQYFTFLLGGENRHSYFIKSIASSHYFFNTITSSSCSRCVEDTPGYTLVHTLVHDKYSPAGWVSRNLRPKCKLNNSVLYPGLLQVVLFTVRRYNVPYIWMCLVLQRDSRFVSRNYHATDIALTERLGQNSF